MEELLRLKLKGLCGNGVKWSVERWFESKDNGELDAFAKMDMRVHLLMHCSNNPFDSRSIQVGFQIKLAKRRLVDKVSGRKKEKKERKILETRLLHQYSQPFVPIIIVDPDKRGKVRKDLKSLFTRTVGKSVRVVIIARKHNVKP